MGFQIHFFFLSEQSQVQSEGALLNDGQLQALQGTSCSSSITWRRPGKDDQPSRFIAHEELESTTDCSS